MNRRPGRSPRSSQAAQRPVVAFAVEARGRTANASPTHALSLPAGRSVVWDSAAAASGSFEVAGGPWSSQRPDEPVPSLGRAMRAVRKAQEPRRKIATAGQAQNTRQVAGSVAPGKAASRRKRGTGRPVIIPPTRREPKELTMRVEAAWSKRQMVVDILEP